MIYIDAGIFQIRISGGSFCTWTVCLGEIVLDRGSTITIGGARVSALAALKHISTELDKDVEKLTAKTYQTNNVVAFRWDGDPRLQDIESKFGLLWYNGMLINEGDWILPDIGISLKNADFTKLFLLE